MNDAQFVYIMQSIMILILQLAAPLLLTSIIVGLVVSIIQSVTQVQESTLTFVPKVFVSVLVFIFLLPWMLQMYKATVNQLFGLIPEIIN